MKVNRREFLRQSLATGTLASAALNAKSSLASDDYSSEVAEREALNRGKSVAIIGGGIAGMTAAHELLDRGFNVSLYEMREIAGGKARSMGSGYPTKGKAVPGEHGFRFYPTFYTHVPDIMKRIPYDNKEGNVFGNMVSLESAEFVRENGTQFSLPMKMDVKSKGLAAIGEYFKRALSYSNVGIKESDIVHLLEKITTILVSCDERRIHQWENISWSDYIESSKRSQAFRDVFGTGMTTMIQSVRGEDASAKTIGFSFYATFSRAVFTPLRGAGSMLNGPTNEVWIDPWLDLLKSKGLQYYGNSKLMRFNMSNGEISSVSLNRNGRREEVRADYIVSALPVEKMSALLSDEMSEVDSQLPRMSKIKTEWMVGYQYYFDQDVRLSKTASYGIMDSPWKVVGVSQNHIWKDHVDRYGNGDIKGILSLDVSDWTQPGILYNKKAKDCTPAEIRNEVWAQFTSSLPESERQKFLNARILHSHLDPGIIWEGDQIVDYLDPLYLNTKSSWFDRPKNRTEIPNLILAGDYVQTHADIACMESACESGKRAANEILANEGMKPNVKIRRIKEPLSMKPLRAFDRLMWRKQNGDKTI